MKILRFEINNPVQVALSMTAAASAEQFGHEIGYAVRFAPDDIRQWPSPFVGETRK